MWGYVCECRCGVNVCSGKHLLCLVGLTTHSSLCGLHNGTIMYICGGVIDLYLLSAACTPYNLGYYPSLICGDCAEQLELQYYPKWYTCCVTHNARGSIL